jgi:tRNA-2-methylthio-N6-dimethylallyladenosine synthase
VNAWGDGEQDLGTLIRALDRIDGLHRIRYMTSHPNDMTDGLIAAHGDVEKLMPYLHLPVQAGNDRILKAMNRSHTSASYLKVIERVRASRPDIAISGDFIVGFPGETDAEFEETLQIIRDTDYALAFSFKYSARPGTPAATMDGQVEPHVMDERLQRLQALLNEQQLAFNQSRVGQRTSILLERKGRHPGQMVGKTPWLQSVHVLTDAPVGTMLEVDLLSAGPNSLGGEVVREMETV